MAPFRRHAVSPIEGMSGPAAIQGWHGRALEYIVLHGAVLEARAVDLRDHNLVESISAGFTTPPECT